MQKQGEREQNLLFSLERRPLAEDLTGCSEDNGGTKNDKKQPDEIVTVTISRCTVTHHQFFTTSKFADSNPQT